MTATERSMGRRGVRKVRGLLLGGACALAAACGGSDGGGPDPEPTLVAVEVTPASATLEPGATLPFAATGRWSDGSVGTVTVQWTATGGTVSAGGAYRAGATPGTFRVVGATPDGRLADTASVTITVTPPTLTGVEVTPATVSLVAAATQQFTAIGRLSDGSAGAVTVTWGATGGTVSDAGLYTAGATPGTYRVIATQAGGPGLADTASVTVTAPPAGLVALEVAPEGARLSFTQTQQYTVLGRLSDGSAAPVAVTWSATATPSSSGTNAITAGGLFTAGYPIGTYRVVATQQGGTLADTVTVSVHSTTGQSVLGPDFWTPTPGVVHLCTSNHYTDDPAGLGGTATVTASPAAGVTQPSVAYVNDANPVLFGDGSGAVRVACRVVWQLPAGSPDTYRVTIAVASNRPGTGMAKTFLYESRTNPQGRADFTKSQDWFPPAWTTATVTEFVDVSATNGANIWFKNTGVP
jgi:hypothetical protein